MKIWFWMLLVANGAFFGVMQWGAHWFAPPVAEQALPELNPQKIALQKLLRPVSSGSAVAASGVLAVAASQTPPVQPLVCMEWAAFSADTLPQAQSSVAQLHLTTPIGQRSIEYSSEYWVYIPPLKNAVKIKQKLAELTAAGLSGVVEEAGQWQRAISLGTFPSKDSAQAFANQHRKVGNLKVGEYRPAYQTSVLLLNNLESASVAKLIELQKQFPDSQLNQISCR